MLRHFPKALAVPCPTSVKHTKALITARATLATIALSSLAMNANAAETIADGTTVRIRSNAIEAGWHTGRIQRDGRSCWTIQLDRPTDGGYTQLALTIVDALQLGRTGAWTAVNAKRALAAEPSHCLEQGSD